MKTYLTFFLLFVVFSIYSHDSGVKIVILGSSTASGAGPLDVNNSWVNRYAKYLKSINSNYKLINLAVGGYTTYKLMPTDYIPPINRPRSDSLHNINKALSYKPNAIIINLGSNDNAWNYFEEQIDNFKIFKKIANENNVPLFVTTTQPRNDFSKVQLQRQFIVKDSIYAIFGDNAIDFWSDIANTDGTISPIYSAGDGIHLNDEAHAILFKRVANNYIIKKVLTGINVVQSIDTTINYLRGEIYPNPIIDKINFDYWLPDSALITIYISDLLGHNIKQAYSGNHEKGRFLISFNKSDVLKNIKVKDLYIFTIKLKSNRKLYFNSRKIYFK